MLVWGGVDSFSLNTGGAYDPVSNAWTATTTTGAPVGVYSHTAVWTGSVMIVWGGHRYDGSDHEVNSGGRYNPATNSWTPTATTGAPSAREGQAAVWTGTRMVVWGGYYFDGNDVFLNTGGRYDPATNVWAATSVADAPTERVLPSAVWTGTRMIVWGGWDGRAANTGGRYDPATNSWTPTSSTAAPSARFLHQAVWTGSFMIVWGGWDGLHDLRTGGRYDPATDSWTPTSTTGAPSPREYHSAVWTGSRMVVWGGWDGAVDVATGGRYDPATDTWTPTSAAGAPAAREAHTAVWTGSRMVLWGGYFYDGSVLFRSAGGRYDPTTDSWSATSTAGAPSVRYGHTAVWTGSVMIVWGGIYFDGAYHFLNTGGRYNPTTDSWAATSMTAAPLAREGHSAVWTGSRMILWGGYLYDGTDHFLDEGNLYDPTTDSWIPTSTSGAPSPREFHSAVWTGSRMLVWGGYFYDGSDELLDTGGRYDPATDSWLPTSTTDAPAARVDHTAVWTGSSMVVWGGDDLTTVFDTGGRYASGSSIDDDGDGYSACEGDCNDANPAVHPGAAESCNGIDDDCDTVVDCSDGEVCTADACDPTSGCVTSHRTINMDTALFSADRVDGRDLVVLADAWNSCSPDPRYNAAADLDSVPTAQGACVDASDFHFFMSAFGRTCS
jgi:N-acetylneuraminic acid mutarotase